MQLLPRSHYSVLEISRHSTTLDIRRSFKRLSKIYHPDKQSDVGDEYFQSVKQSYDVSHCIVPSTECVF
jgi:DnaJ-class molecular chaperone